MSMAWPRGCSLEDCTGFQQKLNLMDFSKGFLGWRMLAQGVWQVIKVTGSLNKAQLNWAESLQLYRGSSCRQTDGTQWEATGPGHLGVIHFQQV